MTINMQYRHTVKTLQAFISFLAVLICTQLFVVVTVYAGSFYNSSIVRPVSMTNTVNTPVTTPSPSPNTPPVITPSLTPSSVYLTGSISVTPGKLSYREEGLEVRGEYPVITGLDAIQGDEANAIISDLVKQKKATAKEGKARSVVFSYETVYTKGYVTILVYSSIISATTRDQVDSVCFDAQTRKLLTLTDILGPNGNEIINKYISGRIKADPIKYYQNFDGIGQRLAFYPDDYNLHVLFDSNKIAPGSEGIVRFDIPIKNIINFVIKKDAYYTKSENYGLKMIPIRAVAEAMGYKVSWAGDIIEVYSDTSKIKISFGIGQNTFQISQSPGDKRLSYALEAPAELLNGITYVPISFFDQIMDMAVFSTMDDGSVLFTVYGTRSAP